MRKFYLVFLTITFFYSCKSSDQRVFNTKPLYGEVEKSDKYKEVDENFRQECINEYGSIDSSITVHIDFAWRYYYNNELKMAMKRFNQAWLLNPEFPDSYFGFAALLETQGKIKDVKRFYNMGLVKDLQHIRAGVCYQKIADCKEKLGDIKGTIQAYESLVELDDNNSFAFKKIGYFKMQLGLFKESLKAYDQAIKLDPNDAVTYNNRAYLNQTHQNFQKAINDFSKAIELNPNYVNALIYRGFSEMELKQFQNAKLDFERCIELKPKLGELRRFLGMSNLKLKKVDEACKKFEIALKLGDKSVIPLIKENCKN